MTDNQSPYMQRAYELAQKGWGKTSPNPMVGAVLVKGGKVIAEGWHARCGADHAEAMAIKKAGAKAKGADLYVTLEPCSHFGRTPPCTQAIINAGIKNVFVGVLDPNPKMNGRSIALLRKAGISVKAGSMQDALTRLNEAFNKYISTGLPFVTAKIAQTIDGKTATLSGESKWITADATRAFSRGLRSGFDGIAVGVNTVIKDNPCLSAPDKCLKKIIIDSRLRLPLKARIFQHTRREDIIVITTKQASKPRIKALSAKASVWIAPAKGGKVDLRWAFKELAKNEIAAILIEGGGTLIGSALKQGLVDKMHIYVAPKIMGEGLASVRGFLPKKLSQALTLKNLSVGPIGEDLFIQGYL